MNKDAQEDMPAPEDFIRMNLGRNVLIKLQNEEEYKGMLISLDGAMNMYLQNCREYVNGKENAFFKHLFIRGNNGNILNINNFIIVLYLANIPLNE